MSTHWQCIQRRNHFIYMPKDPLKNRGLEASKCKRRRKKLEEQEHCKRNDRERERERERFTPSFLVDWPSIRKLSRGKKRPRMQRRPLQRTCMCAPSIQAAQCLSLSLWSISITVSVSVSVSVCVCVSAWGERTEKSFLREFRPSEREICRFHIGPDIVVDMAGIYI